MKIILLSDLHLLWHNPIARLDNAKKTQQQKFRYALKTAKKEGAIILQAGDFFDRPRSWMLLPEIIDILKQYKVPIYGVMGQHDTYFYNEETKQNTSLGILEKVKLLHLLNEKPTILEHNIHVYGVSFHQEIPVPIEKDKFNILVIHAPIAEEALFPNHDYLDARTFMKKHDGYEIILAGDIHRFFCIQKTILNCGPLFRKEATEYNFQHEPGFFIYDSIEETLDWHMVPHEPAEKVLDRSQIKTTKQAKQMLDEFVDGIEGTDFEGGVRFIDNLWDYCKHNKIEKEVVGELASTTQGET